MCGSFRAASPPRPSMSFHYRAVSGAVSSRAAAAAASSLLPGARLSLVRPAIAAAAYTRLHTTSLTYPTRRCLHTTPSRLAHKIVNIDYEPPKPQTAPVYSDRQMPNEFVKQIPENQLKRTDIAYGIGTPATRLSQGVTPRRKIRPYGVQGIRSPRRNEIDGPRALGHKVSRIEELNALVVQLCITH